jgi:hypothetical protein
LLCLLLFLLSIKKSRKRKFKKEEPKLKYPRLRKLNKDFTIITLIIGFLGILGWILRLPMLMVPMLSLTMFLFNVLVFVTGLNLMKNKVMYARFSGKLITGNPPYYLGLFLIILSIFGFFSFIASIFFGVLIFSMMRYVTTLI